MSRADRVLRWRSHGGRLRERAAQAILFALFSLDVPPGAVVEDGATFMHNGVGTVLHDRTVVRSGAMVMQGVTFGDANTYASFAGRHLMEGIVVERGATVCAGAKVLCKEGILTIGEGAVVAANAVVTKSVPAWEVWGGVPARRLGYVKPAGPETPL